VNPTVRIRDRVIEVGAPTFVIAEIGVNHDGDVERAIGLIEAAAAAGADAVKFQWFEADRLVGDASATADYQRRAGVADQKSMLRALELDADALARCVEAAHRRDLAAIVTVFSTELVDSAATLGWDAWKTASPDLVHRPLLEALAADGRPMLVSTGAADLEEIRRTDAWIESSAVAFLHCVSAYPTPEPEAALSGIAAIATATGRPTGYSDHTAETTTGGLAVAAGAVVLEKHLTWSRSAAGPDHAASIEPDGFAEYVRFVRRAHAALGPSGKRVGGIETDVRRVARQSIRAARDLESGATLAESDLVVKRPGDGLEPWRLGEVIGRTLIRDLHADAAIRAEDLA
jgi:N-acetylneuraminate synthase/N,N'-diacetyllegionaminate synthase